MKKIVLIILLLIFSSCSKGPEKTLDKVKEYYNSGNYEGLMDCYTNGTVRAMEDLKKFAPASYKGVYNMAKKFQEGVSWEVLSESVEGEEAVVKVKYLDHPVENMRGLKINFRFRQENGKWKIDEEKEIRESINLIKQMGKIKIKSDEFLEKK